MKASIYISSAKHHVVHAEAMATGLKRHGIQTAFFSDRPEVCDFAVFWGWRRAVNFRADGYPLLIMERGFLGDRFAWTSLGWNGLNGHSTWNKAHDDGERFFRNFGGLVSDHNPNRDGYALIVGQVPGDMSIRRVNIDKWYDDAFSAMKDAGFEPQFRQHPVALQRGFQVRYPSLNGDLNEVLDGAKIVVTYNSNTGVEALTRGIPTIVCDEGAMSWPIANRGLSDVRLEVRDRTNWFRDMSWRQWTIDEISSGYAWECVKSPEIKERKLTALVLGGANNVWTEAERAFNDYQIDIIIAINNSVADYPGHIDAALSLHPVKMPEWLETRQRKGYPKPHHIISHEDRHGKRSYPFVTKVLDYKWPEMKYSGSSGLFAVKAAMEIFGAERVILAGVPMNVGNDHYHKPGIPWKDANAFLPAWRDVLPRIQGRVKSFSGKTADLLGTPSKEWAQCL